jgi:hypothetical protein
MSRFARPLAVLSLLFAFPPSSGVTFAISWVLLWPAWIDLWVLRSPGMVLSACVGAIGVFCDRVHIADRQSPIGVSSRTSRRVVSRVARWQNTLS